MLTQTFPVSLRPNCLDDLCLLLSIQLVTIIIIIIPFSLLSLLLSLLLFYVYLLSWSSRAVCVRVFDVTISHHIPLPFHQSPLWSFRLWFFYLSTITGFWRNAVGLSVLSRFYMRKSVINTVIRADAYLQPLLYLLRFALVAIGQQNRWFDA